MKIVDSHCHIDRVDLDAFGGSIETMLAHAKELSVTEFLCVCIDLEHFDDVHNLALAHPSIYASVGVHPTETDGKDPGVNELIELSKSDRVIAIGETGLDNFYSADTYQWQRDSFINHLKASQQCDKPIIIHTREARDETIALLREYPLQAGGVMHCFTETWEMAEAALELGFYISFSGIVTFNSASDLREVVRQVPLERLLVETDSPWLAPVPHRGKQNEPQYVLEVAQCVADLKGVSLEQLAEITTQNFHRLFKIAT